MRKLFNFWGKDFKMFSLYGIDLIISWYHIYIYFMICFGATIGVVVHDIIYNTYSEMFDKVLLNISFITMFFTIPFVFVIFHEYGHALTAKYFGAKTGNIIIFPLGGMAKVDLMCLTRWEEFWIILNGPLVNVFFIILFFPFIDNAIIQILFSINVALVLFNALPCYPMDGGRLFKVLLSFFTKDSLTATKYSGFFGVFVTLVATPFLIINGMYIAPFILAIMALVGLAEYKILSQRMLPKLLTLENVTKPGGEQLIADTTVQLARAYFPEDSKYYQITLDNPEILKTVCNAAFSKTEKDRHVIMQNVVDLIERLKEKK